MKNKSKVLVLILSAAALVAASVFGTMAYLTDSDQVTNTFTVGNVTLGDGDEEAGLDEALVNEYGQPINNDTDKTVVDLSEAPRVQTNDYKLLPGHSYTKDPTVHIKNDSESCWVFVKVENGISDIEKNDEGYTTVAKQITDNNWTPLTNETNVYYKMWDKASAVSGEPTSDLIVFSNFAIDGDDVDAEDLAANANDTITVYAYAVQYDGFEDNPAGAWDAVKAEYPTITNP